MAQTRDRKKRPSNLREWQELRAADFAALDPARTPVLVAVSPLEVHGPHLPAETDLTEADELLYHAAALLQERHPELQALHLPPLYVAADLVGHRGSVPFRPSTVTRVLTDLARTLSAQGFRHIWVGNFHGGLRHFAALELAAHRANRRYGTQMVSLFSALIGRLTGGSNDLGAVLGHIEGFSPEKLEGDEHGGAIETSFMLHLRPRLVDAAFRSLPRRTVAIWSGERGYANGVMPARPGPVSAFQFFSNLLRYFDHETYAGDPSLASEERGEEVLGILAGHAADVLSELWTGRLSPQDCHSPLWPARHVFLNETLGRLFDRLLSRPRPPRI